VVLEDPPVLEEPELSLVLFEGAEPLSVELDELDEESEEEDDDEPAVAVEVELVVLRLSLR
jgi:hypothetical protein